MKDETRIWVSYAEYPVYSALPQAKPDRAICDEALNIAHRVRDFTYGVATSGEVD